ncbi:MAG: hypothetical protein [Bacteriophage sp.]|nr:MAG: hypothetical protein [Bacteriophage sp.]
MDEDNEQMNDNGNDNEEIEL